MITPSETPQYFTANRATHSNFDAIVDALTDGQHCVNIYDEVVDTTGEIIFDLCGNFDPAPDFQGADIGRITLFVGDGLDLSIVWDENESMWTFRQTQDYSVTIYERLPALPILIDIKPGGLPNPINLKSKSKVPVTILTTDDFDAYNVIPDTIIFAGASPLRWNMEDVDYDGDYDMLLHFNTQELELAQNSIEATLEGETYDGSNIIGTDSVKIVPKVNLSKNIDIVK